MVWGALRRKGCCELPLLLDSACFLGLSGFHSWRRRRQACIGCLLSCANPILQSQAGHDHEAMRPAQSQLAARLSSVYHREGASHMD